MLGYAALEHPEYKTAFALCYRALMPEVESPLPEKIVSNKAKIKIETAVPSWKRHVLNALAPSDVDSISETVEAVLEEIAVYGPASIDLRSLVPGEVNGEHLAALLRVTSPWQGEIPGWNGALQLAAGALVLAGIDHRSALIGML